MRKRYTSLGVDTTVLLRSVSLVHHCDHCAVVKMETKGYNRLGRGNEQQSLLFPRLGSRLAATSLEGLSFSFSVLSFRMGR